MVEAPGGLVVGEPGAENAVELGDARELLERAALHMALWPPAVLVLMDDVEAPCPEHRLRVSWEGPDDVFGLDADVQYGAFIPPLGPPQAGEDRVAGIVYCKGSDYGYMGFDATWKQESKAWAMYPVPEG